MHPHTGVRPRLESIDLLRGVVLVLMALDHTRDFFGNIALNPTDLRVTTVPLFFTRWITHFCAPIFFMLTGAGAFLSLRAKSKEAVSRFLLSRGIWLIVLEVVVLRCFGYQFNADYRLTMLLVLWALGWAMILLALLVRFPIHLAGVVSIAMIAGHNLLDGVTPQSWGALAPLWTILHVPGWVVGEGRMTVFAAYPLIPWVGVAAFGYWMAQIYQWTPERRRAMLWRAGVGLTAAFVVLRAINLYGDPFPWEMQRTGVLTVLSFLNTHKYPPSLLYLLMTLGPALCLLAALDARTPAWGRPVLVFGKVPLFFFMTHFTLIHLVAVVVCYLRYGSAWWMFTSPTLQQFPFTQPPGWGYGLPLVYLIWVGVVVALFPLCRWFMGVKQRRRYPWLAYL